MQKQKDIIESFEFYRILDEVLPGGSYEQAKKNPKTRIYLTHISLDRLRDFHAYSTKDKRFYKYLEYDPFKSITDSKKYLIRLMNLEGEEVIGRTAKAWFIHRKEDNKFVGTVRLINIDFHRQSVMWGYGIDPELWGEGYVFELQSILKEYIFETLCLNRLHGSAMITNKPTISTLIAAGMKEEGVERQSMRDMNGIYYDAWLYSMLAEDYFSSKHSRTKVPTGIIFNEEELKDVIGEVIQDRNKVNDDLMMKDMSSWDSLTQMALVASIESAFDIELTFDEIIEMVSYKAIKDIISKRLTNPQS